MTEEWRAVPAGYGPYEVSSLGRVRNLAGHIMFEAIGTRGYPQVLMVREPGAQPVNTKVHRLVALSFLGPRPEGLTINHIDGIKYHNMASNLEYVTRAENVSHAVRMGLFCRTTRRQRAEAAPRAGPAQKLTPEKVLSIRERVANGETHTAIAVAMGVDRSTVGGVVRGEIWKWVVPQGETTK